MRPMPQKLRKTLSESKFMTSCIHRARILSSPCSLGRTTWEHAIIYAGRQVNEEWAIVPCCEPHNIGVSGKEKDFNRFIALLRAVKFDKIRWDLSKFYKLDFQGELRRLEHVFSEEDLNFQLLGL